MVSLKESSETGCGGATSPLSPSNLVVPSEWTALTGPRRLPDCLAAYQPLLGGDIGTPSQSTTPCQFKSSDASSCSRSSLSLSGNSPMQYPRPSRMFLTRAFKSLEEPPARRSVRRGDVRSVTNH